MTRPAAGLDLHRIAIPEEEFQLYRTLQKLAAQWRFVGATTTLCGLLAIGLTFVLSPIYTASTSFVPELASQRRVPSTLAGIAGQLGLSLGAEGAQSPRFYAEVIRSRALRERLLLTSVPDPRSGSQTGDSATVLEILRTRGHDRADSLERGVRRIDDIISVEIDNQTRIVRVSVDSRYAAVAAALANRLVQYLNEFNADTRQSQARERRRFIEGRITAVENSLRDSEDRLKGFYNANRSWQQSPELTFEEGRLRRQVDMVQELYVSLKREYESARIEEVNDTPVLTVIDRAVVPERRSFPQRSLALVIGMTIGLLGAILWVMLADYLNRARRST